MGIRSSVICDSRFENLGQVEATVAKLPKPLRGGVGYLWRRGLELFVVTVFGSWDGGLSPPQTFRVMAMLQTTSYLRGGNGMRCWSMAGFVHDMSLFIPASFVVHEG